MYVAIVPNRGSPPAVLLRESYREAGKTKNRTLANLSRWPAERIDQLRAVLRGDQLLPAAEAVAQRTSPVAKAEPSPAAQHKAAGKRTDPVEGEPLPVHSFHTLLGDLATLTRNVVRLGRDHLTTILATPTQTQRRALDLLGLTPTA